MITSIVLFLVLIVVMLKEKYPQRIMSKLVEKEDMLMSKSYFDTYEYRHELSLYGIYNKKGNIVMLGNSITYRVDWNELLNRDDIINRGIGRDITQGFINRLNTVLAVEPKLCFIMGGINDIDNGIGAKSIISNLETIVRILERKGVTPILYSVLYAAADYPDYQQINSEVDQVNSSMVRFCKDNSIQFIDLNASFSSHGALRQEYSFDGIHVTAKAYSKWREIILPIINDKLEATNANPIK